MHEAGLAVAVAAELRERGLGPQGVVLRVSGGHGDPAAFDAALRMHLAATMAWASGDALVIEHVPSPRLCAGCAGLFESVDPGAPCPACGGPGIAVPVPEQIELVAVDPPDDRGPERPVGRDQRPSVAAPPPRDAGAAASVEAPASASGSKRGEG
jgi:Zn finger protein HypA/HybF involved in hydrogenase expression